MTLGLSTRNICLLILLAVFISNHYFMAQVKLKPLGDRVIIEILAPETQTASGIYLPEASREKPQIGLIVAVGPGKFDEDGETMPMYLKVGDRVLYSKYAGDEYKDDDKEYKIMSQDSVIAVVTND